MYRIRRVLGRDFLLLFHFFLLGCQNGGATLPFYRLHLCMQDVVEKGWFRFRTKSDDDQTEDTEKRLIAIYVFSIILSIRLTTPQMYSVNRSDK